MRVNFGVMEVIRKTFPRAPHPHGFSAAGLLILLVVALGALLGATPLARAQTIEDAVTDEQGDVSPGMAPAGMELAPYDLVEARILDEADYKKVILVFAQPPQYLQSSLETGQPLPVVIELNLNLDSDGSPELMIALMTTFMTITGGDDYNVNIFQNLDSQTISVEGNVVTITLSKTQLGPAGGASWSFRGLSQDYPAVRVTESQNYYIQDEIPSPPPTATTVIATTTTTTTATETSPPTYEAPPVNLGPETIVAEYEDPVDDVSIAGLAGGGFEDLGLAPGSMDLVSLRLYDTGAEYVIVMETKEPLDPRFFDPQYKGPVTDVFDVKVVLEYDAVNTGLRDLVFEQGYAADMASGNMVNALEQGLVDWGGNRVVIRIPKSLIPPDAGEVRAVYVNLEETGFYRVNATALLSAEDTLANSVQLYNRYLETETPEPVEGEPTATLPIETPTYPPACASYETTMVEVLPLKAIILEAPASDYMEALNIQGVASSGLYIDLSKGFTEMSFELSRDYDAGGPLENLRVVLKATIMGQEVVIESTPFGPGRVATIQLAQLPIMGNMPDIMVDAVLELVNDNTCTTLAMPLALTIGAGGPGPRPTTPMPPPAGTPTTTPIVTTPAMGPGMGEPTMPGMRVEAKVRGMDVYLYSEDGVRKIAFWFKGELEAEGAVDYALYTITYYKDGSVEQSEMGRLSDLLKLASKVKEGEWLLTIPGQMTLRIIQEKPGSMEKVYVEMLGTSPIASGEKSPRDVDKYELRIIAFADPQGSKWNQATVPVEYRLHESKPPSEFYQAMQPGKQGASAPAGGTPAPSEAEETPETGGEGGEQAPREPGSSGGLSLAIAGALVILVAGAAVFFLKKPR